MTKTVDANETTSIETVIALIENGDEVVIEKKGEPVAKVTPVEKPREAKPRVFGLGKGMSWMSDDFNDELPDEFWGFDKES
jgi:antitoxin (DNA-binding transcriptional repressor) of toxin-antitoxin stability system